MAEPLEQIESTLRALGSFVPRFFTSLYLILFRPDELAYRSITRNKPAAGSLLFISFAAFFLTKAARLLIFASLLIGATTIRSCSGETYPPANFLIAEYAKTQLSLPTLAEFLFVATPTVLIVFGLAWAFSQFQRLQWSNGKQPTLSIVTEALRYMIGAQYMIMTSVAISIFLQTPVVFLGLMSIANKRLAFALVPVVLLSVLIAWPMRMYYRFLLRVYMFKGTPGIKTKLAIGLTGLAGATVPIAAILSIAYIPTHWDFARLNKPDIIAVLVKAEWDVPSDTVQVGVRITNNTDADLYLSGDEMGIDTVQGENYCGDITSSSAIEIDPGKAAMLTGKLDHIPRPPASPFAVYSFGIASNNSTGISSPPASIPSPPVAATSADSRKAFPHDTGSCQNIRAEHLMPSERGRAWLHAETTEGAGFWIMAKLKGLRFARGFTQ